MDFLSTPTAKMSYTIFSVNKKIKVIRKSAIQEKREFIFTFFSFFALTSGVKIFEIRMKMSM
jgi:hypothetical protein